MTSPVFVRSWPITTLPDILRNIGLRKLGFGFDFLKKILVLCWAAICNSREHFNQNRSYCN